MRRTSGTLRHRRTLSNQPVAANNGVTHYVWDIFGNIIAEADGATGAPLRETLYLEGMPIAAVNAAAASPRPLFHIHTDLLHRPIMMTDLTASICSSGSINETILILINTYHVFN